ncbi:MAG: DMT family transporter, partial [Campylobacteraceae bacterium]|nr:DMT family transporter [Campylobacteraceae bacterium]
GYFIIASLLWPILTIISAKSTRVSPLVFTFYMYGFTSLLSLPFFDYNQNLVGNYDGIFWLNIFSISILATTFATTIYFIGIETLGAREVSGFIFLVPFSAIGLSAIFLDEKIDFWMIFGTILTIIAVSILNRLKINLRKKRGIIV